MKQFTFYSWRDLLRMAGLAIVYALFARLVLNLSTANGNVTIFWIPGGLALAALLVWGLRFWPAVFLGAFAAGIVVKDPPSVSILLATGNTLETLTAVWLLRRLKMDITLNQLSDFYLLGLAAISCTLISALIGPLTLLAAGYLNWQNVSYNILHWWQGDALGILLSTPLFLVWRKFPHQWFTHKNLAETFALFGVCILAGQIIFLGWFDPIAGHIAKGHWIFLFVVWAAIRRGQHGASLIVCITAIQALIGAMQGVGYFAQDITITGLQNFWFYLLILTLVGISLATFVESQKRAENILVKSMHYQRALLDNFPFMVWLKDTESRFLSVNKGFVDTSGVNSIQDLIGKTDFDLYPQDLAEGYRKDDLAVMQLGQQKNVEEEVLDKGERKWFETYKAPVIDTDGSALGTVGFARDITRRKQTEQSLRVSESQLRLSQQSGGIGTWEADLIKNTQVWSENCMNLLGFPAPSEPTWEDFLTIVLPEDRQHVINATQAHIEHGTKYDMEYRAIDATGGLRWMRSTGQAERNADGQPVTMRGIVQDITERKQSEQKHLAHEIALRKTLVREVHHRIKNSLQGVTGLLNRTMAQHPDLKEAVTNVISQIHSIAIVHGLQGENPHSQIILQDLVREIAENNQSLSLNPLVVSIQANLPIWQTTEEESVPLALVLNELVLNAIKHSVANTDVCIELRADNAQNMLFTISNAGQLSQNADTPHVPTKGTGLTLLDFLLPEHGATLSWQQSGELVFARLVLTAPVFAVASTEIES